ncbi:MAG: DUF2306 domain-containing protein [Bacteroidota bacterium]
MNKNLTRLSWVIMAFLAIGVSGYASLYLNLNPEFGFLAQKEEQIISRLLYRGPFWIHVLGGIIALAIGPFQFLASLRKKRMKLHRTFGKIYVGAILLAGLSGIPVSLMAEGGWIARIGFLLLALTWLYTTAQAYIQIRQGNLLAHKRWMVLSYATTFAAVTLRIWLGILMGVLGWEFLTAYATVAWISWVPNLIVVELVMRHQSTRVQGEWMHT